jgi:hypothetical protein
LPLVVARELLSETRLLPATHSAAGEEFYASFMERWKFIAVHPVSGRYIVMLVRT